MIGWLMANWQATLGAVAILANVGTLIYHQVSHVQHRTRLDDVDDFLQAMAAWAKDPRPISEKGPPPSYEKGA